MNNLRTTIGLEIHVQLKTKSKMFCKCNNEAFGAKPNTTVCPVCLGMPGSLPVANEQAILWTIKTGLALNCEIPKIAKFDRKHYFYPDLPKGYQISQFDEPFCVGGYVELSDVILNTLDKLSVNSVKNLRDPSVAPQDDNKRKIRLTRIHLEEDAGKLIHKDGKSLVDLNRAGTPLMEIVSEPDITSPEEAGAYLRKIQKIVRDEVCVSEASMEKGHLRCDANISITDGDHMSEIVELKNLNSFRFVEKALAIEEARLKAEYPNWSEKKRKVTRGYDSKKNITFAQREKEEAADYRYFPEPDLPPFDTSSIDVSALRSEIGKSEEDRFNDLVTQGATENDARILVRDAEKLRIFSELSRYNSRSQLVAMLVVNNTFGFRFVEKDFENIKEYASAVEEISKGLSKYLFVQVVNLMHEKGGTFAEAYASIGSASDNVEDVVKKVLRQNPNEVAAYKAGKKQLLGFFIGRIMKETNGRANPSEVNNILREKLGD